jgi:hypothetical protein
VISWWVSGLHLIDVTAFPKDLLHYGILHLEDKIRALPLLSGNSVALANKIYRLFASISALGPKNYDLSTNDLGFRPQQRLLSADVAKWKDTFDKSSFRKLSSCQSSLESKSTWLKLHHLTLDPCARTNLDLGNEMRYDALMPELSAIVALCEELASDFTYNIYRDRNYPATFSHRMRLSPQPDYQDHRKNVHQAFPPTWIRVFDWTIREFGRWSLTSKSRLRQKIPLAKLGGGCY